MTVELGDRVKDRISKLQGIAVGITNWLYGCQRVTIQPEKADKEGKPADCFTVDEPQVTIIKKHAVGPLAKPEPAPKKKSRGGPMPTPSRHSYREAR
jgi:hypothetical protein